MALTLTDIIDGVHPVFAIAGELLGRRRRNGENARIYPRPQLSNLIDVFARQWRYRGLFYALQTTKAGSAETAKRHCRVCTIGGDKTRIRGKLTAPLLMAGKSIGSNTRSTKNLIVSFHCKILLKIF